MNKIIDEFSHLPTAGGRHYHRNKAKHRERFRKYKVHLKKDRPAAYLLWKVRGRAKEKGLEFNITEEDIPVPKCCPILGIPLRFGEGRVIDNTPSVDRIDNSKGYIKGNVRVISHRANKLKSDITVAQVKRLLQYMTQACLDGECKVGKDWSITH